MFTVREELGPIEIMQDCIFFCLRHPPPPAKMYVFGWPGEKYDIKLSKSKGEKAEFSMYLIRSIPKYHFRKGGRGKNIIFF